MSEDEITRLRDIIIEVFNEGFVCSRCGEFFDGLPRAGCRSDKTGLHRLKGLSVRESVDRLICDDHPTEAKP